jgi:hypothetical protein
MMPARMPDELAVKLMVTSNSPHSISPKFDEDRAMVPDNFEHNLPANRSDSDAASFLGVDPRRD